MGACPSLQMCYLLLPPKAACQVCTTLVISPAAALTPLQKTGPWEHDLAAHEDAPGTSCCARRRPLLQACLPYSASVFQHSLYPTRCVPVCRDLPLCAVTPLNAPKLRGNSQPIVIVSLCMHAPARTCILLATQPASPLLASLP